eukprot:jgi/Phyca11/21266/fgenesh1_pg.PHYCAscaffold_87_\
MTALLDLTCLMLTLLLLHRRVANGIDRMHGGVAEAKFSRERKKQLESTSDDLVEKALRVYDQFHSKTKSTKTAKQWRLVKRKKSLNVYRERGKSKSKDSRVYLCSGVMPGTVEDMISGTYFDDTENMRIGLSVLMDKFLDARVLHVFEKNPITSSVVFAGVKWLALKTPTSSSLIHDRDILFYNRIGRIVDRQGRYFVYCVMDSIDLDEFPANRHQNLERSFLSLCYLFRQVQEEWVGCFIMGSSSMGGTLPRSAYSARIASSAERIPSTSSSCDVCMKKPNLLSVPDLPEKLDGLADFVERASLANNRDMQWNQDELDYYSNILRESGHFKAAESSNSRRTQSYTQGFHPGSSLPPPDHEKMDRRVSKSYASDDISTPKHHKVFSVDELD